MLRVIPPKERRGFVLYDSAYYRPTNAELALVEAILIVTKQRIVTFYRDEFNEAEMPKGVQYLFIGIDPVADNIPFTCFFTGDCTCLCFV
jgi:hypothetical protein